LRFLVAELSARYANAAKSAQIQRWKSMPSRRAGTPRRHYAKLGRAANAKREKNCPAVRCCAMNRSHQ
jgi:hypothetical protein